MNMKTNYSYLWSVFTLCVLLLVTGCKEETDPNDETPQKPVVTLSAIPTSLSLSGMGGESVITVTTNAEDWSVSTEASWLTVVKENATRAKISAAANADYDRNAVVRFEAGLARASVSVSQGKISAAQADSITLIALYNTTAGAASWTEKWNIQGVSMKNWKGVKVENGRVVELALPSNNLTGALPAGLDNLTQLRYLDLSGNNLSGAIPAALGNLSELYYLDLSANGFSGAAPDLSALAKLVVLDLSDNALTALPALNSSLPALEYLAASGNQITGTLPEGWGAYTKLVYVDASKNQLEGAIPTAWSALTKLQVFYLYKNKLSDSIPAYVTTFTGLESLALNSNDFTKTIPDGLGSLPKLEELWLAQNRLTGSIPASLLGNAHWATWQGGICPQQTGFGFDNCTSSASAPLSAQSAHANRRAVDYKRALKR
jgi:hypothetical protein